MATRSRSYGQWTRDRVELELGPLSAPVCTNIGNPHATFFVDDAETVDIATLGPLLEHDPIFPQRANIGVASIRGRGQIRLRVWERGAGITRACGSGACAGAGRGLPAGPERSARRRGRSMAAALTSPGARTGT